MLIHIKKSSGSLGNYNKGEFIVFGVKTLICYCTAG
uniref:Uncharacterized protein n=1 Tax=Anguilla anguilla TaxID=7936 RepID=A0A0E9Q7K1_ANGAN